MSISTVMTGIRNTIAQASGFTTSNVTIGDYTILDSGKDKAVVLEYQPSEYKPGRTGKSDDTHKITVAVFRKFEYDYDSYTNLLTDVGTIKATFANYPKLNGTNGVIRAWAAGGNAPVYGGTADTGPFFFRMDISLEVTEEVSTGAVE